MAAATAAPPGMGPPPQGRRAGPPQGQGCGCRGVAVVACPGRRGGNSKCQDLPCSLEHHWWMQWGTHATHGSCPPPKAEYPHPGPSLPPPEDGSGCRARSERLWRGHAGSTRRVRVQHVGAVGWGEPLTVLRGGKRPHLPPSRPPSPSHPSHSGRGLMQPRVTGCGWRGGDSQRKEDEDEAHTVAPPKNPSELHLAGREGLILHGHGAIAAQHRDAQLLLPVVGLLVPLVHHQ